MPVTSSNFGTSVKRTTTYTITLKLVTIIADCLLATDVVSKICELGAQVTRSAILGKLGAPIVVRVKTTSSVDKVGRRETAIPTI